MERHHEWVFIWKTMGGELCCSLCLIIKFSFRSGSACSDLAHEGDAEEDQGGGEDDDDDEGVIMRASVCPFEVELTVSISGD